MANDGKAELERRVAKQWDGERVGGTAAHRAEYGLPDVSHERLFIRVEHDAEAFAAIQRLHDSTMADAYHCRKIPVLVLKRQRSGRGRSAGYLVVVHVDNIETAADELAKAREVKGDE